MATWSLEPSISPPPEILTEATRLLGASPETAATRVIVSCWPGARTAPGRVLQVVVETEQDHSRPIDMARAVRPAGRSTPTVTVPLVLAKPELARLMV